MSSGDDLLQLQIIFLRLLGWIELSFGVLGLSHVTVSHSLKLFVSKRTHTFDPWKQIRPLLILRFLNNFYFFCRLQIELIHLSVVRFLLSWSHRHWLYLFCLWYWCWCGRVFHSWTPLQWLGCGWGLLSLYTLSFIVVAVVLGFMINLIYHLDLCLPFGFPSWNVEPAFCLLKSQ